MLNEEKREHTSSNGRPWAYAWHWLNWLFTGLLLLVGIWYLGRQTSLAQLMAALGNGRWGPIGLALAGILLVLVLKNGRWQLMFVPAEQRPSFMPAFWALSLGAYVNLVLPLFRLGEVARLFALENLAQSRKSQTVTTLLIEKSLDMIFLGVTLLFTLTAVVVPGDVDWGGSTLIISGLALALLLLMGLIAFFTEPLMRWLQRLFAYLPTAVNGRLTAWSLNGLAGLAALRNPWTALWLLASTAVITAVSVAIPWLLFVAFDLPLGWVEAAIIHTAVTIALVPPTTPGKIGVFDGVTAFFLLQFGLEDEAIIISYTLLYHLIAVLPLILLGVMAASRSRWRWPQWGRSADLSP